VYLFVELLLFIGVLKIMWLCLKLNVTNIYKSNQF
jgi:hypothetical protein